jgi:hypothetical protein
MVHLLMKYTLRNALLKYLLDQTSFSDQLLLAKLNISFLIPQSHYDIQDRKMHIPQVDIKECRSTSARTSTYSKTLRHANITC